MKIWGNRIGGGHRIGYLESARFLFVVKYEKAYGPAGLPANQPIACAAKHTDNTFHFQFEKQ